MLVDSHAHIELKDFNKDRDDVIHRARENGIDYIVTVGIELNDCRRAVSVAESYEMVFASVGIHPHFAKAIDDRTYDALRELAKHEKVVAYGEIGLDFFRNISPREVQIQRFKEQLELAHELDLPVIIHDREAHKEIMEILEPWNGDQRGIIHCFSGDYAMAKRCLDWGYYISVPGTVTYKNSSILRDVVRKVPLERLLVETDCPFLTPDPKRGKRNEPANVVLTARKVADIKGVPFEEVCRITSANAMDLLGIQ
jgi:TatD DNase family protein